MKTVLLLIASMGVICSSAESWCSNFLDPVCATNGREYSNPCYLFYSNWLDKIRCQNIEELCKKKPESRLCKGSCDSPIPQIQCRGSCPCVGSDKS